MSKCDTTCTPSPCGPQNCCPPNCCEAGNEPKCPVEAGADVCPVETSIAMWKAAFPLAMRKAQVDILSEKIKAEWGDVLDKEADATLAAMGACWQSMVQKGKAQMELRDAFRSILEDASGS